MSLAHERIANLQWRLKRLGYLWQRTRGSIALRGWRGTLAPRDRRAGVYFAATEHDEDQRRSSAVESPALLD